MIFLKSQYSTLNLLYIPRVKQGETVSRDYFQAKARDLIAKKSIRQLETVTFDIEKISPDNTRLLKKFLNETQGYAIQLDFVPHMIRFRGIITEAVFFAGRQIVPINTVPIDEATTGKISSTGPGQVEIEEVIPETEFDASFTLIAPEYIDLTEQMLLNDLEEAGFDTDPSKTIGGILGRIG